MVRLLPSSAPVARLVASHSTAHLFLPLWLAGHFFWIMFVAWTPMVTTGWWTMPAHTACVWWMLAMGVLVTANASATVWALQLPTGPPRCGDRCLLPDAA